MSAPYSRPAAAAAGDREPVGDGLADAVNEPVLPDYAGANVRAIVPALLGPTRELPRWMPEALADARQVVLLVLDGLGWHQLQEHRDIAPTLAAMSGRAITTVCPTTTATALTSITTGLTPGEHGVIGYRIELAGDIVNTLRWSSKRGDMRRKHPPSEVQPFTPFLGHRVPVVSRTELESSGFSEAHLRGCKPVGWRSTSSIAVEIHQQLVAGEPFVYAYYDGVDKIAHERGFGAYYEAELRTADRLVGDVITALPTGSALVVVADHGQVQVGGQTMPPAAEVLALTDHQSGEGRFRWLHAKPGAAGELLAAASAAHGSVAWVVNREQVLEEGWLGQVVSPPVARRLGDVALVAHAPISFHDPLDTGPFQLVCRHGSLTPAEIDVPFLVATAG